MITFKNIALVFSLVLLPMTGHAQSFAERHGLVNGKIMSLKPQDGKVYGNKGRFMIYAAKGRDSVGYNFTRGLNDEMQTGISHDRGAYLGDAQVGVAYRKGALHAGFGMVHRTIKAEGIKDSQNFLALTVTITR